MAEIFKQKEMIFKRHNRMYERVELWAVPYKEMVAPGQWADVTMHFENKERAIEHAKKHNSEAIKRTITRELC